MAEQSKGDLGRSSATSTKQPDAVPAAAPANKTDLYHVVGPGSLMRTVYLDDAKRRSTKVLVPPGELIELTDEEARGYGGLVARGEPPPPPKPMSERRGGRYRVVGTVKHGGEFHRAGSVLTLTEQDARELGASVAEA